MTSSCLTRCELVLSVAMHRYALSVAGCVCQRAAKLCCMFMKSCQLQEPLKGVSCYSPAAASRPSTVRRVCSLAAYSSSMRKYSAHSLADSAHIRNARCMRDLQAGTSARLMCGGSMLAADGCACMLVCASWQDLQLFLTQLPPHAGQLVQMHRPSP